MLTPSLHHYVDVPQLLTGRQILCRLLKYPPFCVTIPAPPSQGGGEGQWGVGWA